MATLVLKSNDLKIPLRFASFYELYKKFIKEHGGKWYDVVQVLNVIAEIVFDIDNACTKLIGKVRL